MSSKNQGSWKMLQSFGEKRMGTDDQTISAIEYDETGDYFAAGSKTGRISVYSRHQFSMENGQNSPTRHIKHQEPNYSFHTEFKSHDAEFDYLKSLEIEEKINKIKWCKRSNNALFLLSTNDKTIKLWKVYDKKIQVVSENNIDTYGGQFHSASTLRFPTISVSDTVVTAAPKRVFSNAHAYHINSIAMNSDGETYLSADDLRINLWSLGITNQSFNIVDIKPSNMEELTEVITAADFHPSHCNIMMYSSSRGSIKLGDMREAALCDNHAKVFEEPEDPASKSFFSEIIASISDVKFSPDGQYVIARDYLTLKIWDLKMERAPVQTINIHEQLRPKLCDLYENDCIFDKFECSVSGDGNSFITGSYNGLFHIYDRYGKSDVCIEASKGFSKGTRRRSMPVIAKMGAPVGTSVVDPSMIDFNCKVLHTAWHPQHNEIAVARDNNLFFYSAP